MIGYWLTYNAELQTRPDVLDVTPYLAHYIETLRAHPEVTDATYQYEPTTRRVAVHLYVRHALTPDFALLRGRIAVHEALSRARVGVRDSALPAAQICIDTWPDSIRAG